MATPPAQCKITTGPVRRLSQRRFGGRIFAGQPAEYRDQVLPPEITARVAIEAGVTFGWREFVGPQGVIIGLDRFGASAPYERIYQELGLTAEAMAAAARQLLQ